MKPTFILLLLVNLSSTGQNYSVKKDSLISFLYSTKGNVTDINTFNPIFKPYLPVKIAYELPIQKLIKNNNGLYIIIDGTGQVYKAISNTKDSINFAKVDSTIFFGHNYGSIKFSYLDTIYNFGGNGYWHFFGHLIYFNEGSEWEIKKLNKEYFVNSGYYYFNYNNAELYYIQIPYNSVSTSAIYNQTLLYKLNIKTNKNELIGNVREDFFKFNGFQIYFSSKKLNGLLFHYNNDFYLLNFDKNEIHLLTNKNLKKALDGSINERRIAIFEKDSLVYIVYGNNKNFKAYNFELSDFELTNHRIFYNDYSNFYLIIAIVFGVLILLVVFYIKQIKTKVKSIFNKPFITNALDFNEVEKNLINLLIVKADNEQFCDVDEVNKILGLAKKTLEVQKKLRTEQIHRINHKFKINYNIEIDLIERHKTEEDRRFIKYGISKSNSLIYKR